MSEQKPNSGPIGASLRILTNPYLLLTLAALFWAGNHIAGKIATGKVPPLTLAGMRWLIAAAILWPFVSRYLKEDWPLVIRHWKIMLLLCTTGGAIFAALQYTALNHTIALNASIVNSVGPIVIALVGAMIYRDSLNRWQMAGVVISLIGVLVIVSRAKWSVIANMSFNIGDVYLVLNMAVWGIYSACLRDRPAIHPLSFTFFVALAAGVMLIPAYIYEYMIGSSYVLSFASVAVTLYVAIFPGLLGYMCWNIGIEKVGASRGGIFLHMVPVFGIILAIVLLGEQLRLFHATGFALIIFGVWMTSRKYDNPAGPHKHG